MSSSITKLTQLLEQIENYLLDQSAESLEYRRAPGKWSKKEVLGHLIDSAINNLQRFTEIQFAPQPYVLRPYSPHDLVMANDYQNAAMSELIGIWKALNQRILKVVESYPKELLEYQIIIGPDKIVTLDYWIRDYMDHMEHHLKQINT